MTQRFYCGDIVREKDGRHIGKITWLTYSMAGVQWVNGWKSDCELKDLELVHRALTTRWAPSAHKTITPSPKRELDAWLHERKETPRDWWEDA